MKEPLILPNWDVAGLKGADFTADIDPGAKPGEYLLSVTLIFTDSASENRTVVFNFNVSLKNAFKVIRVQRPGDEERQLQITVRNYIENMTFKIKFKASGDIKATPVLIEDFNLTAGEYTYRTDIVDSTLPIQLGRHLWYGITAEFNGRTIRYFSDNIEFSEARQDDHALASREGGISIGFLYLLLLIIMYVTWKKRDMVNKS